MYRNSTFSIDELFKQSVLIISYTNALYNIFKRIFSKYINSEYITKSLVLDICYLIDQIRKDLIVQYMQRLADFKAPLLLQYRYKKLIKDSVNIFNAFLLTIASLLFNLLIYSFSNAYKNIEVLGEATKYIYIVYCPNIIPIPLLIYIIVSGPRNRTLHLYVVRPTSLLVFGLSRANAETLHSCGQDLVVVETLQGVAKSFYMRW